MVETKKKGYNVHLDFIIPFIEPLFFNDNSKKFHILKIIILE